MAFLAPFKNRLALFSPPCLVTHPIYLGHIAQKCILKKNTIKSLWLVFSECHHFIHNQKVIQCIPNLARLLKKPPPCNWIDAAQNLWAFGDTNSESFLLQNMNLPTHQAHRVFFANFANSRNPFDSPAFQIELSVAQFLLKRNNSLWGKIFFSCSVFNMTL